MRFVVCLLLSILCVRAHAGDVARVEGMLSREAAAIGLADAKLAIDVAIDARVDAAVVRAELDAWTKRIEARTPEGPYDPKRTDGIDALVTSVREAGLGKGSNVYA